MHKQLFYLIAVCKLCFWALILFNHNKLWLIQIVYSNKCNFIDILKRGNPMWWKINNVDSEQKAVRKEKEKFAQFTLKISSSIVVITSTFWHARSLSGRSLSKCHQNLIQCNLMYLWKFSSCFHLHHQLIRWILIFLTNSTDALAS